MANSTVATEVLADGPIERVTFQYAAKFVGGKSGGQAALVAAVAAGTHKALP